MFHDLKLARHPPFRPATIKPRGVGDSRSGEGPRGIGSYCLNVMLPSEERDFTCGSLGKERSERAHSRLRSPVGSFSGLFMVKELDQQHGLWGDC